MIKKLTIYIVLAVLCQNFSAKAQFSIPDSIKAIRPGARPDSTFWSRQHLHYRDGQLEKANLSVYRDKLLLLDFWATWCTSCFAKFKTLDSLQAVYPDFKVLLVNSINSRDKTPAAMEKLRKRKAEGDPVFDSIMEDVFLAGSFPHKVIPHYVWIMNGQIYAVTGSDFLNGESIKALLERKKQTKTNQPN